MLILILISLIVTARIFLHVYSDLYFPVNALMSVAHLFPEIICNSLY